MGRFGQYILAIASPGWESKYIEYNLFKDMLHKNEEGEVALTSEFFERLESNMKTCLDHYTRQFEEINNGLDKLRKVRYQPFKEMIESVIQLVNIGKKTKRLAKWLVINIRAFEKILSKLSSLNDGKVITGMSKE